MEEKNGLWFKIVEVLISTILVTIIGYLINNINNLQKSVNDFSSEIAVKGDKLNDLEINVKERNSFFENLKEENAVNKEKISENVRLIEHLRKENDLYDENFQKLKDRVLLLESKK